MEDAVFGKTMENVRKRNRYIKLVGTDKKEIDQYQNLVITQQNGFQRVCQQQK